VAAFATVEDVQTLLGEQFDTVGAAQVQALLDDVSELIRTRRPLTSGGVVVKSETHPEYAYTLTDAAAAGLALTDEELDLLTPQVSRSRPFSIQPG
jgi:hypothetical protein